MAAHDIESEYLWVAGIGHMREKKKKNNHIYCFRLEMDHASRTLITSNAFSTLFLASALASALSSSSLFFQKIHLSSLNPEFVPSIREPGLRARVACESSSTLFFVSLYSTWPAWVNHSEAVIKCVSLASSVEGGSSSPSRSSHMAKFVQSWTEALRRRAAKELRESHWAILVAWSGLLSNSGEPENKPKNNQHICSFIVYIYHSLIKIRDCKLTVPLLSHDGATERHVGPQLVLRSPDLDAPALLGVERLEDLDEALEARVVEGDALGDVGEDRPQRPEEALCVFVSGAQLVDAVGCDLSACRAVYSCVEEVGELGLGFGGEVVACDDGLEVEGWGGHVCC